VLRLSRRALACFARGDESLSVTEARRELELWLLVVNGDNCDRDCDHHDGYDRHRDCYGIKMCMQRPIPDQVPLTAYDQTWIAWMFDLPRRK